MTRQEIIETVYAIIVEHLGIEQSEISLEKSMTNDLGADSLDSVELIMDVETKFNIKIEEEEAERISTVGDIVDFVEQTLNR